MSPPSDSDEPPIATSVNHEAQATEKARHEEIKQNVASISSLRGVDHLLKMEELIANNRATVDWLSKTDIVILEVMDPRAIPPAIKEKINDINMTITMRISAAEQRPARVMEVRGDLFQAPMNAALMRTPAHLHRGRTELTDQTRAIPKASGAKALQPNSATGCVHPTCTEYQR
jgi:hypothetical protein